MTQVGDRWSLLVVHGLLDGAGEGDGIQHEACGTTMEPRWWCPTCERPVDDAEGDDLRFV